METKSFDEYVKKRLSEEQVTQIEEHAKKESQSILGMMRHGPWIIGTIKWIRIQDAIPQRKEPVFMYYRDENDCYNPHMCFGYVGPTEEHQLVARCRCVVTCYGEVEGQVEYVIDREKSRFYWMYVGDVPVPGWEERDLISLK